MAEIYFYDKDLKPILQTDKFISLNHSLRFMEYGKSEVHFSLAQTAVIDMLTSTDIIIMKEGGESFIVTGYRIDTDVAVFLKSLSYLLTKRCLMPFSITRKTPLEIVYYTIETAMDDFVTCDKAFTDTFEDESFETATVRTVYDIIAGILTPLEIGFRLDADVLNKKYVFKVYKGADCETMLSPSLRTAHNMVYTSDISNIASRGFYNRKMKDMGSWSPASNSPLIYDNQPKNAFTYYSISATANRFNMTCTEGDYLYSDTADGKWKTSNAVPGSVWVNTGSAGGGIGYWETVLSAQTKEEAEAELKGKVQDIVCDLCVRRLKYGVDYFLGGRVTAQFEARDFKKPMRFLVSGADIAMDMKGSKCEPVLTELEE